MAHSASVRPKFKRWLYICTFMACGRSNLLAALGAGMKTHTMKALRQAKEDEMKARTILVVALVAVLSITMVGQALAAGTWYWYDVTVPRFGGSTTSNNQTKQFTGQASISSNLIGGNYDLQIRLELVDNTSKSSWYRINDGTFLRYNNTASAGNTVHTRFKSDLTDYVNIQANGNWSPDTP